MNAMARIIDANSNRAREALRVMEDLARFRLDDQELSRSLKRVRHDLTSAIKALPLSDVDLLVNRDVGGDVGTEIVTPQELRRSDEADMAGAAGGRLTEALRSIEEASKALNAPAAAATIEAIRYRAYEAQQKLVLALRGGRAPQWRVGVLITESRCKRPWLEVARLAIVGGAKYVQIREKSLSDRELLARTRQLVELAHPKECHVIVNDRADLAMMAKADGVHVGQTDLPAEDIRRIVGSRLLVGVSASNMDDAKAAVAAGADYVGLGPMFKSTTKPKDFLSGPGLVKSYMGHEPTQRVPHLAISGITRDNLQELLDAGCAGIAVSNEVCGADDPTMVVGELIRRMARTRGPTLIFG